MLATPQANNYLIKHLLTLRERIQKNISYFQVNAKEAKGFSSPSLLKIMARLNRPALQGLSQSSKEVDKQMIQLVEKDIRLNHVLELLISIPQIGNVTALHLITATNEFKLHTDPKH
jgi:transposase